MKDPIYPSTINARRLDDDRMEIQFDNEFFIIDRVELYEALDRGLQCAITVFHFTGFELIYAYGSKNEMEQMDITPLGKNKYKWINFCLSDN